MNESRESDVTLTLYVTGKTLRSTRAIDKLSEICASQLDRNYNLVVVDVLEDPEEAERRKILATPTVIKELPPQIRRIVGDLSDTEKVLMGLDISKA